MPKTKLTLIQRLKNVIKLVKKKSNKNKKSQYYTLFIQYIAMMEDDFKDLNTAFEVKEKLKQRIPKEELRQIEILYCPNEEDSRSCKYYIEITITKPQKVKILPERIDGVTIYATILGQENHHDDEE